MKVKKLRNGYTVKLTNSDYELLAHALKVLDPKTLSGDAKRAYSLRSRGRDGDLFAIDVDASTAEHRGNSGFQ